MAISASYVWTSGQSRLGRFKTKVRRGSIQLRPCEFELAILRW